MRAVGGLEPGSSSGNPVGGRGAGTAGSGQDVREMPVKSPGQSPSSCGNPGSGTSCLYHLESFWAWVVLPVKWGCDCAAVFTDKSETREVVTHSGDLYPNGLKPQTFVNPTVSEGGKFTGDLAGCFLLRTSSEVNAKMLARLQSSEGMTRVGGCASSPARVAIGGGALGEPP